MVADDDCPPAPMSGVSVAMAVVLANASLGVLVIGMVLVALLSAGVSLGNVESVVAFVDAAEATVVVPALSAPPTTSSVLASTPSTTVTGSVTSSVVLFGGVDQHNVVVGSEVSAIGGVVAAAVDASTDDWVVPELSVASTLVVGINELDDSAASAVGVEKVLMIVDGVVGIVSSPSAVVVVVALAAPSSTST